MKAQKAGTSFNVNGTVTIGRQNALDGFLLCRNALVFYTHPTNDTSFVNNKSRLSVGDGGSEGSA